MKIVNFEKWDGAGNDFVVVDNRQKVFDYNRPELVALLCDRRRGIGGDGMLLLEDDPELDFKMVYINSDGSMGSMCGNGGRVIAAFASSLGLFAGPRTNYRAVDGVHEAFVLAPQKVKLRMQDMEPGEEQNGLMFAVCGTTPHHVMYVEGLSEFPVLDSARKIKASSSDSKGVNVNFVESAGENTLAVRTYERGVEDETLACGTGACSVAIISHGKGLVRGNSCTIKMPGGELGIEFDFDGKKYKNIWLTGPVRKSFKGQIELKMI